MLAGRSVCTLVNLGGMHCSELDERLGGLAQLNEVDTVWHRDQSADSAITSSREFDGFVV